MNIRFANEGEKKQWDDFIAISPYGSFLQSWAWGDVQLKLGTKIWRLVAEGNGGWKGLALVMARPQPFGRSWLYAPQGPVVVSDEPWAAILNKLVEIAHEESAIFIRIDPAIPDNQEPAFAKASVGGFSFRKSEREVQPRHTLVLDLTKSEEALLKDMRQKTRYNIRLAQKRGIQVRFSADGSDVDHFLRLAKDVSARTMFSFHPDTYYRAIIDVLGKAGMAELALAEFQGEVLAAHLVVSFAGTVTYLHGASSSTSRELMAPHLLQWETIMRAKAAGRTRYDFFSVAPEGADTAHSWAGITRFKLGFGGRRVNYIGAYDLVLHGNMYHLFNAARRFKSLLR